MSRLIRRAAIAAAITVALASLTAVGGATTASGQEASEPVPIVGLAPPVTGAGSSGPQVSPGHPGNSSLMERGVAPEATVLGGTGGGQPLGTESVIGPDGRVQVTNTTQYPASAIGQITLFQDNGQEPGNYICTGWLIDNNSILTSGHCSYDPPVSRGGNGGGIIANAQFFPGRNGASNPFGGCNVVSVFAKSGWINQGRAVDDWSIQQLDCTIGATVGVIGYFTVPGVNQLDGKTARVEGYPGDKPPGTHWKMSGTISSMTNANNVFYPMDTAGGQSGSPIMVANRPSCGGPCGMGIHSYGSPPPPFPQLNSGPRITQEVFDKIADIADNNGG
jgi:glutamyl endopeptidase